MKLINLTPHALTLRRPDGSDLVLPPSGTVARVDSTPGAASPYYGGCPVPVHDAPQWGAVVGLPGPEEDTLYVVSLLTLQQCRLRDDVVAPGTGPKDGAVRDEKGQVVAVTRLVRG